MSGDRGFISFDLREDPFSGLTAVIVALPLTLDLDSEFWVYFRHKGDI